MVMVNIIVLLLTQHLSRQMSFFFFMDVGFFLVALLQCFL